MYASFTMLEINNAPRNALLPAANIGKCVCDEGVSASLYNSLYCEAKWWERLHQRAKEREQNLLQEIALLKKRQSEEIKTLKADYDQQLAELRALLKKREAQLFGKKTEKGTTKSEKNNPNNNNKRQRGAQPGAPGHGRRNNTHLPVVIEYGDLAEDEKHCKLCEKCFKEITKDGESDTQDSETLECHVKAHVRRYKRYRYKRTCTCPQTPHIITAPPAPKLIPKGKIGISLWVHLLLNKYAYYNPTYRLLRALKNQGLSIAQGTVTDGLKKITPLFAPLYDAICERGRQQFHHQADETRWQVFEEKEGKVGYRWYLWIFLTKETSVYYIDPTRSQDVPKKYFKDKQEGTLMVDRYSAYKAFVKGSMILLAFCWAHVRRDFLDLAKAWGGTIESWAMTWVEKIRNLYALTNERLKYEENTPEFIQADKLLREAVSAMELECQEQLKKSDEEMPIVCKKVLISLEKHWAGLTVFLDYPEIPMDNNGSERGLRGPVLLRNSSKGSGCIWSSELMAMMLTLVGTLERWGINPHTWLLAFLTECAYADVQLPADWQKYLPWNMSEEKLSYFKQSPYQDTS